MAEIIDDVESFTITLTSAEPVSESVSLEWVRDNYDISRNRYISFSEVSNAATDHRTKGTITEAQYNAVHAAYKNRTLLPEWPATTIAKGQLVYVTHPSTGEHNTNVTITCKVRNTGDASGRFVVSLTGGNINVRSSQMTVSPNATSPVISFSARLPTSGSKVIYSLKCIRIV